MDEMGYQVPIFGTHLGTHFRYPLRYPLGTHFRFGLASTKVKPFMVDGLLGAKECSQGLKNLVGLPIGQPGNLAFDSCLLAREKLGDLYD